jgi:hypothetical protein
MGETIGMGIAVLVIAGFVLCMAIFFITWGLGYDNEKDEKFWSDDFKVKPTVRKLTEKELEEARAYGIVADNDKQPRVEDTSFVVTNMKDSVVVTEVVYAD